jgi:hypothetical protein
MKPAGNFWLTILLLLNEVELIAYIQDAPIAAPNRTIWFLYEWLLVRGSLFETALEMNAAARFKYDQMILLLCQLPTNFKTTPSAKNTGLRTVRI